MTFEARSPSEILEPGLPPNADYCEVSTAIRLLGDRWSLLIVRELGVGNTRFGEIRDALPGLSRSLLASRLRYLERLGIVDRKGIADTDGRAKHAYALTDAGRGLEPVLRALGDWALTWRLSSDPDDRSSAFSFLRSAQGSIERSLLPDGKISIQFFSDSEERSAWLRVDRTGVRACLGSELGCSDLVVRSSPAILSDLHWGRRTCRDAIARRDITFEGPVEYARRFPTWFPNRPAVRGPGPVQS
ncbi:winged helix-turn-helix transcriptional regulator [Pseudonocardia eucalypti]|uniref:Winged helix-turn-helix transcriptional regulator n=1 Tax=Pseudonocardia eucalypti TaxID=648755 RepID=A0ABP9PX36_9PSEU|nr:DNA-binding HxlR family transcriptional regulator [Pseudonocardia eucalypti]